MHTPHGQHTDPKPDRACPRCGQTFSCDVREGCWCEKLTLDQETLKVLRTNYLDCLCENCLKTFQVTKN